MSKHDEKIKKHTATPGAGASAAETNVADRETETTETTETAEADAAATEEKPAATAEVEVTEGAATSTLSIVPTAAVVPEVAKVRLFWQKSCHSQKESTLTPIKDTETFVRTTHQVGIIPPGSAAGTAPVAETVYSLKRGKRIYYTPSSFITDAQRAAADLATDAKGKEKEAAAKLKADEKAKKEQEKKDKAAQSATIVAAPIIVAAPATEAAPTAAATEVEEVK